MKDIWPSNIEEARRIQFSIKEKIKIAPFKKALRPLRMVASVDAAFLGDRVIAAACLYDYKDLEKLDEAVVVMECAFPYVPGYLSFREGPAVLRTIEKLLIRPDLIIFDGQGIAHPRGAGLASHLGVLLDVPSIGCAKSRLIGEYKEPGNKKGMWSPLKYKNKTVGAVLRTKDGVRPVFVSAGHKIDMEGSIEAVLGCTRGYRLPEPQRCADRKAGEIKRMLKSIG